MNPHTLIIAAAGALLALGGCSTSRDASPQAVEAAPKHRPMGEAVVGSPSAYMPRAVIYKTSGDYADNVPVQLAPDGSIASYPAPSDVAPDRSTPVALADGFLLDRRGISPAAAFTRYTYAEYAALPQAPTPEQIRAAIIPGARVTEMFSLPMTPSEARADTAAVNEMIRHDRSKLTPVELPGEGLRLRMKK